MFHNSNNNSNNFMYKITKLDLQQKKANVIFMMSSAHNYAPLILFLQLKLNLARQNLLQAFERLTILNIEEEMQKQTFLFLLLGLQISTTSLKDHLETLIICKRCISCKQFHSRNVSQRTSSRNMQNYMQNNTAHSFFKIF